MAKTATHIGTCQVCGSTQMLPGGVLSLHGYTVNWGFFNGVCAGAKHLPFEQDKSLIEAAITRAKQELKFQQTMAHTLRQLPTVEGNTAKAWVHLYRAYSYPRKSGYEWREVELTLTEEVKNFGTEAAPSYYTSRTYRYTNPLTQKIDSLQLYDSHKPLAETVQMLNTRKAEGLHDGLVKQAQHYIKWQTERIANWAPQELKPRKEGK